MGSVCVLWTMCSTSIVLPAGYWCLHIQTVRRSDMTRTILPAPTISTNFSCQLRRTLMACPPPSPALRECIWEKPVGCGESPRVEAEGVCEVCDIPLYLSRRRQRLSDQTDARGRRSHAGSPLPRGEGKDEQILHQNIQCFNSAWALVDSVQDG